MKRKETIFVWEANRSILSSEFGFPPDRNVTSSLLSEGNTLNKSTIAERSKMTIFDGGIVLVFDDNTVSIHQSGEQQWDERVIVYYLSYKTFLSYNWLSASEKNSKSFSEVNSVSFNLHRYISKYSEETGKTFSYIDTEPCKIILNQKDISDYLTMLDNAIMYAICYYLLGCDTQRYFLIEFYKCLEVIKNHFKNENEMKKELVPHGFNCQIYDEMKKLSNDRSKPLSIGRHAPVKGIPVHQIDTKWLFGDPTGRKTFETGEKACRNIIDSYIKFRTEGD